MENIDIQQIESYLRGKMTPEEQGAFEAILATNPEMRHRTEELRQMAEGIRQVARADIRQRVEAMREKIEVEENTIKPNPEPVPTNWGKSAGLLVIGLFLGLGLGWLVFNKPSNGQVPSNTKNTGQPPAVALEPLEAIATVRIPAPQPGKTIQLAVRHQPALEAIPSTVLSRIYALDRGGVGLCIYARRSDDFWKKPLALMQSGQQFFLKIGEEQYPLLDDGEEHAFPEKPSGK